jgi:peroxiredoxin (alkyl hydroperoxide reductase subunit C)
MIIGDDMEEIKRTCLPQIGAKALDFDAVTTFGNIRFSEFNKGHYVVLFSHPGDFTPVCTTEFMAFAKSNELFEEKNTKLLGLSIDGLYSHLAWVDNIVENAGIEIPFPVIADADMAISKLYGMISEAESSDETVRTVFIIDDKGIVRLILYYPLKVGRNIMEILRCVDALQFVDQNALPTPANWMPGSPAVLPPPKTYEELKVRQKTCNECNCLDWYLCFVETD